MKKLLFIVPILAVALAITAASDQEWGSVRDPGLRGQGGEAYRKDLGIRNVYVPKMTTDAIPRFTVRFDDARDDQYEDVKLAVMTYGLDVGLAININNISDTNPGTRMSITQIKELLSLNGPNGARVHLMQHWNDNGANMDDWPGDAANASVTEEYLRETVFGVSTFRNTFGQLPSIMVVPGDAGRVTWWNRNLTRGMQILQENGIQYVMTGAYNHTEGDPAPPRITPNAQAIPDDATSLLPDHWVKPGMQLSPFHLPTTTMDLGNSVVERPSGAKWAAALAANQVPIRAGIPLPLMRRDSDGWTYESKGRDAVDTSGVYLGTFRSDLYGALANNAGFVVVLHEQDGSWESFVTNGSIPGGTGWTEAEETGSFHNATIFYLLAMLQEAGHLKVVDPVEWCEWATSMWAPYTDLIANPAMRIPQVDIGDTIGAVNEYLLPRGISSWQSNRSTPAITATDNGPMPLNTSLIPTMSGGEFAFEWPRDGNTRTNWLKRFPIYGETEESPTAPLGGFWVHDRTDGSGEQFNFSYGPLPPGRYRHSLMVDISAPGSVYTTENFAYGAITSFDYADHMGSTDTGSVVYGDTIVTIFDVGNGIGGPPGDTINWTGNYELYPNQVLSEFWLPPTIPVPGNFTSDAQTAWIQRPSYAFLRNINQPDAGNVDSTLISAPALIYMGP